jgi:TolA-binding protein
VPKEVRTAEPPKAHLEQALALYDRILEQHPSFDRYDLVLYMKAYALIEAGRTREALFAYQRIIDSFPNSRFQADAHMAFAEWHFSGSYDYKNALAEYEVVLSHPESELSDLALFKSAWCLWKLGRTTEAAKRFKEVLDLGGKLRHVSAARRKRLLELQDEALEYLIQVFTEDESNTAADLHGFLSEIGGEKYATKVLRRLSRAFFDQARYERAVQAYSMLLESEPTSPHAPDHQAQIVAAYAAQADPKGTRQALEQLVHGYVGNTVWTQAQGDPEDVKRAAAMIERTLRVQAMRYHARGQREKQAADFEQAAAFYALHVASFPDAPQAYEMSFYLGEIQFHRNKDYAAAGKTYLHAAHLKPEGPLTKDALYNAVVAFETVRVAELSGCKKPEPGKPLPDACRETDTDKSFSEAIELYVKLFPKDPEIPEILFRQGRMYFERGVYDPAVRHLGELLRSYPNSEHAAAAGELVLESFNRAQDWTNIEKWARSLKSAPAFQTADAQHKLDALIVQAVFKAGESLAAQKKYAEAADAYERAAREMPSDARAPQAYYNAGQQWQAAGELDRAAAAYGALVERHPGSNEGALGSWTAAQMFEGIAQFRDAAHWYELYAERFPNGDKRADALYNAVVLRLSAGDHAEVVEDGQRFAKAFPSHEAVDDVLFMVGRAHEAEKRWDAAAGVYAGYMKKGKNADRRVEAATRLALVSLERGDGASADRSLEQALGFAKKAGSALAGGRYYAAQARFLQGDRVLAEFERIEIKGERRTLQKRLQQKSELLRKAASIYGEVVEFQVAEWVTAALYKIGQSYELFAEALRAAPVPDGLDEAQEQAYRDQLASFVVPIEERALEAYEGGYQRAVELRVFNRWTQKLREGLTRLNDVQYPPLRELGAELQGEAVLARSLPLSTLRRGPAGEQAVGATAAPTKPDDASKPTSKPKPQARRSGKGAVR